MRHMCPPRLSTDRDATKRGAPAVEGGEGAAFAGEVCDAGEPLPPVVLSSAPGGGSLLGADQSLRVGDELLDPRTHHTGLLAEVFPHGAHFTLKSAPILANRALNHTAALA